MFSKRSCETCPLRLDCVDFAAKQREIADSYDVLIEREETEPAKIMKSVERLGIILDERVAELTYDYMSGLSPEEAAAVLQEKKDRDKLYRSFEEIALHGVSGARIGLLRDLQAVYIKLADASETYARELQERCHRGVGSARSYGLIGLKHL